MPGSLTSTRTSFNKTADVSCPRRPGTCTSRRWRRRTLATTRAWWWTAWPRGRFTARPPRWSSGPTVSHANFLFQVFKQASSFTQRVWKSTWFDATGMFEVVWLPPPPPSPVMFGDSLKDIEEALRRNSCSGLLILTQLEYVFLLWEPFCICSLY